MAEYINPQWRLPNEKTGNNKSYSMALSSNQYLSFAGTFDLLNFSISFWIKVDSYSPEQVVLGGNGLSSFTFESATSVRVEVNNTSYSWSPGWTLTTGEWQHIVLDRDVNNLITVFRNGVHYTANAPTTASSYFESNAIGRLGGANGLFIGEIAELAYFKVNLSQSSINALYNAGVPGNPMAIDSKPVRYYQLGNSAFDGAYLVPNQAAQSGVLNFYNGSFGTVRAATNQDFDDVQKFTFCGWIMFTNVPGRKHIFAIDDSVFPHAQRIDINVYNSSLRFNVNYPAGSGAAINNIQTTTPRVYNNEWFHYSGVFDGTFTDSDINVQNAGRLKLYLNGVPQTVTFFNPTLGIASSIGSLNVNSQTVVGGFLNSTFPGFNGPASNFQLFDDALTPSEILTIYNNGIPLTDVNSIPKINNLKTWYKLDGNNSFWNNEDLEWKVDNSKNPSNYRSSLNFDGSSDYIDCGNDSSLQLTSSFTLSTWVKLTSLANGIGAAVIAKGTVGGSDRSVALYLFNSGGQLRVSFALSSDGSSQTLNASSAFGSIVAETWYNITATFNGSTEGKVYINGTIANTTTVSAFTPRTTSSNLRIGLDASNSFDLNGKTSNVQIFNTVLPETGSNSIETIYNNGTPLADMSSFSSLVSWWKLDNTTTGIEDSKGSNNGTNNGATLYSGFVNTLAGDSENMNQQSLIKDDLITTEIYSPYALAFDGNDYIDCGNSADFSFGNGTTDSPFSTSFWFKLNSNSGTQPFLSKDNVTKEWTVSIFGGGGIRIFLKNLGTNNQQSIDSTTTFSTGVWYHAVTTYDGRGGANAADGLSIYINGSLDAPTNVIKNTYTAMSSSLSDVTIGKYGGTYINGVMSNVAIWNTELTPEQVTEIYNEGLPSNLHNFSGAAPVAWWQLGSNSSWTSPAWTVLDEIGSNNGTSNGMLENALTNGVGDINSGYSGNMSLANNISGSSPNGDGNSLSVNMTLANITGGVN